MKPDVHTPPPSLAILFVLDHSCRTVSRSPTGSPCTHPVHQDAVVPRSSLRCAEQPAMQDATSCRKFLEYTLRVASVARRSNARSAPGAARAQACQLKNQGVLVSAPAQQSSQPAFARSTWLRDRGMAATSTWVHGLIALALFCEEGT